MIVNGKFMSSFWEDPAQDLLHPFFPFMFLDGAGVGYVSMIHGVSLLCDRTFPDICLPSSEGHIQ